jgi:O-Antigen ligase
MSMMTASSASDARRDFLAVAKGSNIAIAWVVRARWVRGGEPWSRSRVAESRRAEVGGQRGRSGWRVSPDDRELTGQFDVQLPAHALLLLTALAAGVVAQGGYYFAGRAVVVLLTLGAVGMALRVRPRFRADLWPLPMACVALTLWTLAEALAHATPAAAAPIAAGLACLAGGAVVLGRTGPAQREAFAAAAVGVGVLVALTGWIGLAWHHAPWASVVEARLWRAAATLTYANAAAALLAALCLLAMALVLGRPHSPVRVTAAYLCLVGLGATLSRGGLIALLVGMVVLVFLAGLRTAWPILSVLFGAGIALAGLLPSMPATASAQPVPAALTLLLGAAVAVGLIRLPARVRRVALPSVLVLLGLALAGAVWYSHSVRQLATARLTVNSSGRSGAATAALRLIADQPWTGVGPGRSRYIWTAPDGQVLIARYAHDEYLQLLVELGTIGLVLLLCLLISAALTVHSGRRYPHSRIRAGAVAALAALAVHSGFDFLWQLTVIPLACGLFIGLAGPDLRPVATQEMSGKSATHEEGACPKFEDASLSWWRRWPSSPVRP